MLIYASVPKFKPKKKKKAKAFISEIPVSTRTKLFTTNKTFVPNQTFRRETSYHPSLSVNIGSTEKRDTLKYTGTLVKGIATMHKSNAVPVINEEQMKDISRMRRG
jgi:hypothetical protein